MLILLAAGPAFGQAVDSNIAVSSFAQSRGDPCSGGRGSPGCGGCYPGGIDASNPLSLLATVNPEWQPIGPMISGGDASLPPDSEPVLFTGTVELTKVNISGDFPASHITDDQNTFIMLDPDNSGLIATGNSQSSNCPGENCNRVEVEREIGKYPLFAWAGEGDRFTGSAGGSLTAVTRTPTRRASARAVPLRPAPPTGTVRAVEPVAAQPRTTSTVRSSIRGRPSR